MSMSTKESAPVGTPLEVCSFEWEVLQAMRGVIPTLELNVRPVQDGASKRNAPGDVTR